MHRKHKFGGNLPNNPVPLNQDMAFEMLQKATEDNRQHRSGSIGLRFGAQVVVGFLLAHGLAGIGLFAAAGCAEGNIDRSGVAL